MGFELDAYLRRVGYGGDTRPTFETLAALLRAHMLAIPWENVDVLLGRGIRIDLEGVQQKLVQHRRGGYCFEHGTLFAAALEALGFAVSPHVARVTLFVPRPHAPRTHMFLTVALPEGRFVVDPGFGGLASDVPLPIGDTAADGPRSGTHRIDIEGGLYVLRALADDKWIDAWVSTLEQENPIDFEMANHFTSTHPGSQFVNRLLMRALTPDGRVTVMNREATIRKDGAPPVPRTLDRAGLRALLNDFFGFDLPEAEQLRVPSVPEWT
ncbi:MAG TPA: arylamine N-acetyltransferase [Polyangia bacterium]|nr:arylamine N-acetyltransferase [Polyangia bacterium]